MAIQMVTGFMWKTPHSDKLIFCDVDMSSEGWILVGPHDTVFEIPADFNPVAAEISQLNKQLDVMAEKYHAQTAKVRDRIATLLCIEHDPKSQSAPVFPAPVNFDEIPF